MHTSCEDSLPYGTDTVAAAVVAADVVAIAAAGVTVEFVAVGSAERNIPHLLLLLPLKTRAAIDSTVLCDPQNDYLRSAGSMKQS